MKQFCCGPRRVDPREDLSTSGGAPGGRLFQAPPDNGRVPPSLAREFSVARYILMGITSQTECSSPGSRNTQIPLFP